MEPVSDVLPASKVKLKLPEVKLRHATCEISDQHNKNFCTNIYVVKNDVTSISKRIFMENLTVMEPQFPKVDLMNPNWADLPPRTTIEVFLETPAPIKDQEPKSVGLTIVPAKTGTSKCCRAKMTQYRDEGRKFREKSEKKVTSSLRQGVFKVICTAEKVRMPKVIKFCLKPLESVSL
jgi:hypothetical protein